ncbi:MAG: carboxypeptidase regulatory-like domain-containing protein [Candidatus Kapaibacterium sp.]
MRQLLYALICFSLLATNVDAQTTGSLRGRVVDELGEAIPGATVLITGTPRGASTDADGKYLIPGLLPGTYTMKVISLTSSEALTAEVEVIAGKEVIKNFAFEESGVEVEGVVLMGKRIKRVDAIATGYMREVTTEEFLSGTLRSTFGAAAREAKVKSSDGSFSIRGGRASEVASGFEAGDGDLLSGAVSIEEPSLSEKETKASDAVDGSRVTSRAPSPNQLTAGEWNDLREWDFWRSKITSSEWKGMKDLWGFGRGERISVRVDNGSEPIADAVVTLVDKDGNPIWQARSDNFGRAELFTGLEDDAAKAPYTIVASSNKREVRVAGVDPEQEQFSGDTPLIVRIAGEVPKLKTIDVMFVIDATGSMSDELNYIKAELASVVKRVEEKLGEKEFLLRLSTNVYRDHGDEYLVRSTEFTESIDEILSFLSNQVSSGGGDAPEAVEEALKDAIENHVWSSDAQSRFLFLLLDAPPHQNAEDLEQVRELTTLAAEKGIRIIPVASSGVDKPTEFLLRFLALHTGGTYVFLTDHSGIGGSHIEPTIGGYDVEFLDDLLVRLIVQFTERPESLDAITARTPNLF